MSESMVERVAQAVHRAVYQLSHSWEAATEAEREYYRDKARAAIAAMREPTDAMEWVGYERRMTVGEFWTAMIDEALK